MNRQERRRKVREGGRKPAWDMIITIGVLAFIVIVFACVYLFPDLNVADYKDASPRVLSMIVNRGVNWLEKDWQNVAQFSFGYYQSSDKWPSFTVDKATSNWKFTSVDNKQTTEYAASQLPTFYRDLPQVLTGLKSALGNKEFKLAYQKMTEGNNDVSLIRVVDVANQKQEQYSLTFTAKHQLDRVIYYNSTGEQPIGYSFVDLYAQPAASGTNP